jgi:hypothetical protein
MKKKKRRKIQNSEARGIRFVKPTKRRTQEPGANKSAPILKTIFVYYELKILYNYR